MAKKKFFIISIILLFLAIGLTVYNYSYIFKLKMEINQLTNQKADLENKIRINEQKISEQQTTITELKAEVKKIENELRTTKQKLQEMTEKYEEAKPYQERVERGQDLDKYYNLLSDNQDYAKPIILGYLGLSNPTIPKNDDELWERGKKVYNWISDNYYYCGDKGLRVGTTFYEFQFFSPDELLMSDNARCGDCDDFATLFAGLMYASGVPENKVWVVCGGAGQQSLNHCWNWLSLSTQTYRIDSVCSQKQSLINLFGLSLFTTQGAYYTSTKENVGCFSEYSEQMKMNPNGYYLLI